MTTMLWFCKQCGMVIARDEKPDSCLMCGADARFPGVPDPLFDRVNT